MNLRPYQQKAIDESLACHGNALIVLPGGSGKSLVAAGIIKRVLEFVPSANILILHPRKELIEQNFDKFFKLCPEYLHLAGIYSASVGLKQIKQITFAGIQSIYNKAEKLGIVNILICDECHLIKKTDDGMFRSLINALRFRNPKLHIIGLTATPFRTESGIIMEAKKGEPPPLFSSITYEVGMRELISRGFLCPLVGKFGGVQADLSKVAIRRGEYVVEDMENAISPITKAAVEEVITLGSGRKHWLVFCPSVKHAHDTAREFTERGITSEAIDGTMSKAKREEIFAKYRSGFFKVLCNCEIATIGYDFPELDLIAILRGTKSAGLFVQMCVRGSRIADGKTDCMILDYAGNLERFGAVDNIRVKKFKLGHKLDINPLKRCPQCGNALAISLRNCSCGYIFERLTVNHEAESSNREPLSIKRWVEIADTTFQVGRKNAESPPYLKAIHEAVTGEVIREFICLEHKEEFPHKTACKWWRLCCGQESKIPLTVEEGFGRIKEIKSVRKLLIMPDPKNSKYWKVLDREIGERVKVIDEALEDIGINI